MSKISKFTTCIVVATTTLYGLHNLYKYVTKKLRQYKYNRECLEGKRCGLCWELGHHLYECELFHEPDVDYTGINYVGEYPKDIKSLIELYHDSCYVEFPRIVRDSISFYYAGVLPYIKTNGKTIIILNNYITPSNNYTNNIDVIIEIYGGGRDRFDEIPDEVAKRHFANKNTNPKFSALTKYICNKQFDRFFLYANLRYLIFPVEIYDDDLISLVMEFASTSGVVNDFSLLTIPPTINFKYDDTISKYSSLNVTEIIKSLFETCDIKEFLSDIPMKPEDPDKYCMSF